MSQTICYTWGDADFAWNLNEYTWNDVCLVISILDDGGGGTYFDNYQNLPKEDKEKFIELTLKIKGKTIIDKKQIKDYKITVDDVHLTVSKVLESINISITPKR